MMFRRAFTLLVVVGCPSLFVGNGCSSTKASSPDAANPADGPMSAGGTASGGVLGMGGGSGGGSGKGGGGALNGGAGAGGNGGTTASGGTTVSGGATGLGGTTSSGGTSGHPGAADGGDVDSLDAASTDGSGAIDGAVDREGELHCAGTPRPCPTFATSCPPGCYLTFGGYCMENSAPACSSNTTATTCAAQQGCTWSDATPACTGTPVHCGSSLSYSTCLAAGCQYQKTDPSCFGTPTPCSQLSVSSCTGQPGCALSAL